MAVAPLLLPFDVVLRQRADDEEHYIGDVDMMMMMMMSMRMRMRMRMMRMTVEMMTIMLAATTVVIKSSMKPMKVLNHDGDEDGDGFCDSCDCHFFG